MTERPSGDVPVGAASAGALLRAARESQGLHVAALAAAIKIPQRKLEALESGRFDELPDTTFARALALTVCRALKIDPAPVLAHLPQAGASGLTAAKGGLNAPFRDRPGRSEPAESALVRHRMLWAALLVLLAALALFLLPTHWWQSMLPGAAIQGAAPGPASAAASGVSIAVVPTVVATAQALASAASPPVVEVVHSVPAVEASAPASADAASGVAVLRAAEASWVEVTDALGQVLVQRLLQPGESLGLDGTLPFRLKIGNASATQLLFRGQNVDLAPLTRDNVARFELK